MRSRVPGWLAVLLALLVFVALAVLPIVRAPRVVPAWVAAAEKSSAKALATSTVPLAPVRLSAVAQVTRPGDPPVTMPVVDTTHMAALVAGEDDRLRGLLRIAAIYATTSHRARHYQGPQSVPVKGGVPTLILPARAVPYTLADLVANRAATPLSDAKGFLLVESVLVAPLAKLDINSGETPLLRLNSSATGFTSLVTWGGTLTLSGTPTAPLTLLGWDQVANRPAADSGYGRPYVRDVGGRMDLSNVRAASLGFYSGRTGGVAWTGINRKLATGGATSSTFIGNTYGAFVSRSDHMTFADDRFEGNELDGLRLHRGAASSTVTGSGSGRNGGNGFVVSRGAFGNTLRDNLAQHNGGNGFLLDGQPIVKGASPSGGLAHPTSGTVLEHNDSRDNLRTGILVLGGANTTVRGNIVYAATTAIAVRAGATNTMVAGNDVRHGGRTAVSIGPAVSGTTVTGNDLQHAQIGIVVRDSASVHVIGNRLRGMAVFGIAVRGTSGGAAAGGNTIDTALIGNVVEAGSRTSLTVGPAVNRVTVAGNLFQRSRIGIVVRNSSDVRINDNQLRDMSVFGISVRGASPGVIGRHNTIRGLGLKAIDSRAGAPALGIVQSDLSGWQHRASLSTLSYLRYHPIFTTWVVIVGVVAACWTLARIRRRTTAPYQHTMVWERHDLVVLPRVTHSDSPFAGQMAELVATSRAMAGPRGRKEAG